MILWDSKKRGGRPDTMQLLKDTWRSFGAEVIFITSNMQGNDEMMQGCRAGTFPFGMQPGDINSQSNQLTSALLSWIKRIRHSVGLLINLASRIVHPHPGVYCFAESQGSIDRVDDLDNCHVEHGLDGVEVLIQSSAGSMGGQSRSFDIIRQPRGYTCLS